MSESIQGPTDADLLARMAAERKLTIKNKEIKLKGQNKLVQDAKSAGATMEEITRAITLGRNAEKSRAGREELKGVNDMLSELIQNKTGGGRKRRRRSTKKRKSKKRRSKKRRSRTRRRRR
jgi:hypothetical protein